MAGKFNSPNRPIYGLFLLNREEATQSKENLESIYELNVREVIGENCLAEQIFEKTDGTIHKIDLNTGITEYICASNINLNLVLKISEKAINFRRPDLLQVWENFHGKLLSQDARLLLIVHTTKALNASDFVERNRSEVIRDCLGNYADKEWDLFREETLKFFRETETA